MPLLNINDQATRRIFQQPGFITDLGIELVDLGAGWVETRLALLPKHLQQDNYVHAGVQTTLGDHTAGAAAYTLVAENEYVLTVEFKFNFLRAAQGSALRCRAEVLKPGKMLSIVESEVFVVTEAKEVLVAKGMVTLAVLQKGA